MKAVSSDYMFGKKTSVVYLTTQLDHINFINSCDESQSQSFSFWNNEQTSVFTQLLRMMVSMVQFCILL